MRLRWGGTLEKVAAAIGEVEGESGPVKLRTQLVQKLTEESLLREDRADDDGQDEESGEGCGDAGSGGLAEGDAEHESEG